MMITVPFDPLHNAMDKKRQKRAPREFKRGPGPTGRARLVQRMRALIIATARFSKKATPREQAWAALVTNTLRTATDVSDLMDRNP